LAISPNGNEKTIEWRNHIFRLCHRDKTSNNTSIPLTPPYITCASCGGIQLILAVGSFYTGSFPTVVWSGMVHRKRTLKWIVTTFLKTKKVAIAWIQITLIICSCPSHLPDTKSNQWRMAQLISNLCASHIVAEKMVIALLVVVLLREEACMDRAGPAPTTRVISNGVARERKGVFATPAQQPGCAPGLQAALFAHLARLGARLREAKKVLSAWLPGNTARVRFPGARLRAVHAGRFRRLPRVGGVAGAGSRGKVKLPRAREG
jgi:hypothetical protein